MAAIQEGSFDMIAAASLFIHYAVWQAGISQSQVELGPINDFFIAIQIWSRFL